MKKIHEMTCGDSCLNKAEPDEPVFVLRGKDAAAPGAIRQWCSMRIANGQNKQGDDKINEALQIAYRELVNRCQKWLDDFLQRNNWTSSQQACEDEVCGARRHHVRKPTQGVIDVAGT